MATRRWVGGHAATAQVSTVQVTAYDAATTYKLTINGKVVSTIAAGSVNATATALAAAWNNSTIPEFTEVTASANTDTVTLTSDSTVGEPFTCASSVTGGTGTIGAVTEATAPTGPHHWDQANNWAEDTVPVNGDEVYFQDGAVSVLYALDQNGVTLDSLDIDLSFTGKIGLPDTNEAGGYREYRETWHKISATALTVGQGTGSGSSRVKLNLGTAQTTANVFGTGPASSDLPALLLKGTHASNVLNFTRGSVGVAVGAGETSVIATLRVGYQQSRTTDVVLRVGSGVTLTTVEMSGGTVELNSAATTLNLTGGLLTHRGGAVTTANVDGGTLYYQGTGTLTTLNVGNDGTADFSRDMRSRTVTNCTVQADAAVIDPYKTVTWTNGIDLDRCSIDDLKRLDLGTHFTLTPSAI